MLKYVLFLDNDRHPLWYVVEPFVIVVCSSYLDFVQAVAELGIPSKIYFDYDLEGKKTGADCAKFLIDYCSEKNVPFPPYTIQSTNVEGKEEIKKLLKEREE